MIGALCDSCMNILHDGWYRHCPECRRLCEYCGQARHTHVGPEYKCLYDARYFTVVNRPNAITRYEH